MQADYSLGKKFLQKIVADGDTTAFRNILSSFNAKKDDESEDNNTLLHTAIQHGREEIVEMLVSFGAGPMLEEVNNRGMTPLRLTISRTLESNASLLLRKIRSDDVKIPVNYLGILNTLIDAGADVNAKDEKGRTPLHWSASLPRFEIYLALTRRGALESIDVPNPQGQTPLFYAAYFDNQRVARALVSDNARVDVKTKKGQTAMELCLSRNNFEMAKILVEAGADVDSAGDQGQTALHLACCKSNFKMLKFLIERKSADVCAKDQQGRTPLHWAAMYGDKNNKSRLLEVLLKNQADPRALDNDGKKPIDYLQEDEDKKVFEMLWSHEKNLPPVEDKVTTEVEAEISEGPQVSDLVEELRGVKISNEAIDEITTKEVKKISFGKKIRKYLKKFKTNL